MKPSFLRSTLSFAFMLCIATVIAMIFMGIDPNEKLLAIITGVVSAYLASRHPQNSNEPIAKSEEKTTI